MRSTKVRGINVRLDVADRTHRHSSAQGAQEDAGNKGGGVAEPPGSSKPSDKEPKRGPVLELRGYQLLPVHAIDQSCDLPG